MTYADKRQKLARLLAEKYGSGWHLAPRDERSALLDDAEDILRVLGIVP